MKDTHKWFPFPYVLGIALLLTTVVGFQNYLLSFMGSNKPEFNPGVDLLYPFVNYSFWSLLSPLVWRIVKKYRPVSGVTAKLILKWTLGGVVLALAHEFITNILFHGIRLLYSNLPLTTDFLYHMLNVVAVATFSRFLEYWIIFFCLMIWGYYQAFRKQKRKIADIKRELLEAKLEALKAQLHPHFLFNTLNSVSALMTNDVQSAQNVLSNLAQLLRALFKQDAEHLVTLAEELDYIGCYLKIEEARFSDRLQVDYQIDTSTKAALVPKLILQPLVENAIKHGIGKCEDGGKITISSSCQDSYLMLTVKDNGMGMQHIDTIWESAGVGLSNTKERLYQLYEDQQSIEVTSVAGSIFRVNIKFLFETK